MENNYMKKFIKHILKESVDERDLTLKGIKNMLNNKIKNDDYYWVDSIDIVKKFTNWKNNNRPINEYIINFNSELSVPIKIQNDLYDYISLIHNEVYPFEDNAARTFFMVKSLLPNGDQKSFPYVKEKIYENKGIKGFYRDELFIFNKLYSKKEDPYMFPFEVYNFIKTLGYDDKESKELFTLYSNNYISSGEFDKLKNVDRSNKLHDEYFEMMFDAMFDPDELNSQNPYDYDDEGDEYEDMDRLEVYVGDYEDGENTIFRWYAPNYFNPKNTENRNLAPFIELENLDLQNDLMETFGEDWIEPFKKWVKNNVGVEVKNILI
jgi:hypothetical protein